MQPRKENRIGFKPLDLVVPEREEAVVNVIPIPHRHHLTLVTRKLILRQPLRNRVFQPLPAKPAACQYTIHAFLFGIQRTSMLLSNMNASLQHSKQVTKEIITRRR